MGQRCSDTRTITFEDVVVPKEVASFLLGIYSLFIDITPSTEYKHFAK